MSSGSPSAESSRFRTSWYGWVIVVLAALAMVATLPGRTHGLGMITERLLNDTSLGLSRERFGDINLWATLIGALFCLPCGWMIDKFGLRTSLTLVVVLLGAVVVTMTSARGPVQFAVLITLTRGLGQSALSVISISMIGKWFRERLTLATGVYSALVSVGFIAAFLWGRTQSDLQWRTQWRFLGEVLLIGLAPLFLILVRPAPGATAGSVATMAHSESSDFTMAEALTTPAFWTFGIATALYGLVSSGVSLFNESLLAERGFAKTAFYDLSMMTTAVGLTANILTGWISTRVQMTSVASAAMILLAAALLGLPFVSNYPALVVYAVAMGCAGGMVTVLFFAVWARLYGRSHLGRIQGVAQMLTVIASALGPKVLAHVKETTGSYLPAIVVLGGVAAVLAIIVAVIPVPQRRIAEDRLTSLNPVAEG